MKKEENIKNESSCIINPESSQKKWYKKKKYREYLIEHFPGKIYYERDSKEKTIQLAKKICQDQKKLLAAGGDGTVADVLQGIFESKREKEVLFGILPMGSGNAFRKSLDIPLNPRKALEVFTKGNTKEIDLIDIEGKVAGFASIGVVAELTNQKNKENISGFFGHFIQTRKVLSLNKNRLEIELIDGIDDNGDHFDKKDLKLDILDCVIGKTKYFGYGWKIAPKAKLDDGYLDITFFEISALKYLIYLPLIFFGLYQKTQKHFKAKRMIIQGKDLHIQYHGEYLGTRDKIDIKILPRAIKVICPL